MSPCSFCSAPNVEEARACRACGAPMQARDKDTALPVGARLQNGAFQIERVLGRGGFGVTYQARDLMLERTVAVKEFFPQQAARQGAMVLPGVLRPEEYGASRGKFLEEARMLARFKHPGIVDVYSVFEENNSVYMTMEFARGKTLGQLLSARNNPMDESEAVGYIRQVGEALAVVHDSGLLHRDIKPENVVVDMGRVLLIDFGTAGEQAASLSESRRPIIVTPGYAPLEQYAQSARRGPFTDVYALGATLYHLLSGQAPPPAPDLARGVEIKLLQELNGAVSRHVAQTVHAALQTEVAKRPQTVRAFLSGLDGSISFAPDIEADPDDTFGDDDYDLLNRRAKAIQDLARGHREALGYLPPLTPKAASSVAAPHTALPVVRVPSAASATLAPPIASATPVSSATPNSVAIATPATRAKFWLGMGVAVSLLLFRLVWILGQPHAMPYSNLPSTSWRDPGIVDMPAVKSLPDSSDHISQSLPQMGFSTRIPITFDANTRGQIQRRYEAWKAAHAASNPEKLLQFYAPDARTTAETLDGLRLYLQQNGGYNWQNIEDLQAPRYWFRLDGQVAMELHHRYSNSRNVDDVIDDRRLFWQQRHGQWMIVRDEFASPSFPSLLPRNLLLTSP